MDVREKLVELLGADICKYNYCEDCECFENEEDCFATIKYSMADHLIANGVTVQEWISVDDRLPEKDGAYLVTTNSFGDRQSVKLRWFAKNGENVDAHDLAGQKDVWYLYDIECGYVPINSVTHWMPLPLPPKGE